MINMHFDDTPQMLDYIQTNTKTMFHITSQTTSMPMTLALLLRIGKNLYKGTTTGTSFNIDYSIEGDEHSIILCEGNVNDVPNNTNNTIQKIVEHIETESVIRLSELCYGAKEIIFSDAYLNIKKNGEYSFYMEYTAK